MNEALIHRGWIGDPDGIREWLTCGADINAIDARFGRTALMCASYNGHVDAVKVLLEKGADANIKGPFGEGEGKTALDLAGECRSTNASWNPHCRSDEEMDKAKAEIKQLVENQLIIDTVKDTIGKIEKEVENEFMALWSTHWKYAVVGVGVLILLMIIICIICICRQAGQGHIVLHRPLVEEDFVPEKHAGGADKTTLMQNKIWNAVAPLQEGEGVYFHYTSKEVAPLIAQSGFKVSNLGMQGTGVYFSVYPPVYLRGIGFWPNPQFPQWPNPGFKEALLRLNYGDAATDPARQHLVDAVIIVKAPADIAKDVCNRPGAVCIADKFYCHNDEPFMMKSQIVKIVDLF